MNWTWISIAKMYAYQTFAKLHCHIEGYACDKKYIKFKTVIVGSHKDCNFAD